MKYNIIKKVDLIGRFNKYEYAYKKENSELILHCKWNGWEWDDNNNSN